MLFSVILTVFLLIWGVWIVYIAGFTLLSGQEHEKLLWMNDPVGVAEFVTWAVKGTIGLGSGLFFTIRLYYKRKLQL